MSSVEAVRGHVSGYIDQSKRSGAEISEAHEIRHLTAVAELTLPIGRLFKLTQRESENVFAAAMMHDLLRNPTEDPTHGDEAESAVIAQKILVELSERGQFLTSPEDQRVIMSAIRNHSVPPALFTDPRRRNTPPQEISFEEKATAILFTADKLEANGGPAIIRRFTFVPGDRLRKPNGDLRKFGFEPNRDEAIVVLWESGLRLAFINPETIYPDSLQPIVHPAYEIQRDAVRGLFRVTGMTVRDLAELYLTRTQSDGKTVLDYLQGKGIPEDEIPKNIEAMVMKLQTVGGLYDQDIYNDNKTPLTLAASSQEAVYYFSTRYEMKTQELVENWHPNNPEAVKWKEEMLSYLDGTWAANLGNQVDQYLLQQQ